MQHDREQNVIKTGGEITKELIRAAGEAAHGLLSNQIAGTATFMLAATALAPEWLPIVEDGLGSLAKAVSDAFHGEFGLQPPLPPVNNQTGQFCVAWTTVLGRKSSNCFSTEADQQKAIAHYSANPFISSVFPINLTTNLPPSQSVTTKTVPTGDNVFGPFATIGEAAHFASTPPPAGTYYQIVHIDPTNQIYLVLRPVGK